MSQSSSSMEAQPQLCRHLKASGHRCLRRALPGDPYCYAHGRDQRRPGTLQIPLIEDRADLLQLYTGIMRSVADGSLNLNAAKLLLSAARNMSQLLALPRAAAMAPRRRPATPDASGDPAPEANPEPQALPSETECVEAFSVGPNGEDLAPPQPWTPPVKVAPEKKVATREWSFDRFLRDSLFPDQAGRPLPESGYAPAEKPAPEAVPDAAGPTSDVDPDPTPAAVRLLESSAAEEPAASAPSAPAASEPPQPGIVPNLWAVGLRQRCRGFHALRPWRCAPVGMTVRWDRAKTGCPTSRF